MKILKRRKFIERSLTALAGAGMMTMGSCMDEKSDCLNKRFIHHVFFWLKDPANPEVRRKFETALKKLVTIETIAEKHLGLPAPTERQVIDNSYTYSLFVSFRDIKGHEVYQDHPVHMEFIKECEDLWERVLVYDSVNM